MTDDCLTSAGRHWRVSSQTATAAIATVTATVTVSSWPSCLPLGKPGASAALTQEAAVRREVTEGTVPGSCCSAAERSRAFRYGTCLARACCPPWSKLKAVLVNVLGNFKHSVGYSNTLPPTPLPAPARSCQAARACLSSSAEGLAGCGEECGFLEAAQQAQDLDSLSKTSLGPSTT